MGRNAKVAIAAVVVVVLLGVAFATGSMPLTIAVAVIGGVGIFFLLRQEEDDEDDEDGAPVRAKRDPNAKKGKARLDEILDDKANKSGEKTTRRSATPPAPAAGGLPTWTPGSIDSGPASVDDLDELDTGDDASWDTWEKEWPQGDDADTIVLDASDDDPLASLDRLDDIEPVADPDVATDDPFASLRSDVVTDDSIELDELDELDQFDGLDDLSELEADLAEDRSDSSTSAGSPFSFAAAPAPINEEVSTADDIMAASTATELHVEEAGDSELARLLAKVQARLSAYE